MTKSDYNKDGKYIWGELYLQENLEVENVIEAKTFQLINAENGSKRLKAQFEEIGSALSLLSQIASCSWNCLKGDHLKENLIRRFMNFCLASIKLANIGYYTESIGANSRSR